MSTSGLLTIYLSNEILILIYLRFYKFRAKLIYFFERGLIFLNKFSYLNSRQRFFVLFACLRRYVLNYYGLFSAVFTLFLNYN